jgi:hypothetical protein
MSVPLCRRRRPRATLTMPAFLRSCARRDPFPIEEAGQHYGIGFNQLFRLHDAGPSSRNF